MQNLTTTLQPDIQQKSSIVLPAGKALFNWLDIKNIAEAVVQLLEDFDRYEQQAFKITGLENRDFGVVAELLSRETGQSILYKHMNPLSFYLLKRKNNLPAALIRVMIMLHFLPRFQRAPAITDRYKYKTLTGKERQLCRGLSEEKAKNLNRPFFPCGQRQQEQRVLLSGLVCYSG